MAANFLDATLVTAEGMRRTVTADDMRFRYRHTALKDGALAGVLTTVRVRLGRGDARRLRQKRWSTTNGARWRNRASLRQVACSRTRPATRPGG